MCLNPQFRGRLIDPTDLPKIAALLVQAGRYIEQIQYPELAELQDEIDAHRRAAAASLSEA